MKPGPRNLITDVAGLRVGNAQDTALLSGVSVLTADTPFTAAVHVMGGAPGTRETDLLAPDKIVQTVDALVLSGGSAFGLDAAGGVMDALRAQGRGFRVGDARVPIVPGAIVFDLLNGGDKAWTENPYRALGRQACEAAAVDFAIGTQGAGTGAMTAQWKGGLGSASAVLDRGFTVGALVVVNALGSVTVGDGPQFWAAPWEMMGEMMGEMGGEFGRRGHASQFDPHREPLPSKRLGEATTIAIIATDAALSKTQAHRLAVTAHDGFARAIVPSHTPLDGDLIFAAATGAVPMSDPVGDSFALSHAAAAVMARAIARAVHAATPLPRDRQPCWQSRWS